MIFRSCKSYIGKAFSNMWRNRVTSLLATIVIAFCLALLGVTLILGFNISSISEQIEGQYEIHAYVDMQYSEEQAKSLKQAIESIEYVAAADFVSKDDALLDMQTSMEDSASAFEMLKGEENPLPHTFDITLTDVKQADFVVEALSKMDGVEEVKNRSDILEKLISTTRGAQTTSFAAMIVFAFISIFIISYTIKTSVQSRSGEIEIMKYVGATDWYIRWPFIIEGAAMGIIGAIITYFPVYIGYGNLCKWWDTSVSLFEFISPDEIRNVLVVAFLLIGCFLGAVGSIIAISRHLKV